MLEVVSTHKQEWACDVCDEQVTTYSCVRINRPGGVDYAKVCPNCNVAHFYGELDAKA